MVVHLRVWGHNSGRQDILDLLCCSSVVPQLEQPVEQVLVVVAVVVELVSLVLVHFQHLAAQVGL